MITLWPYSNYFECVMNFLQWNDKCCHLFPQPLMNLIFLHRPLWFTIFLTNKWTKFAFFFSSWQFVFFLWSLLTFVKFSAITCQNVQYVFFRDQLMEFLVYWQNLILFQHLLSNFAIFFSWLFDKILVLLCYFFFSLCMCVRLFYQIFVFFVYDHFTKFTFFPS